MPGSSARSPTGSRASCPSLNSPRVLELGCGTGLFSRHLLRRYPEGRFVLSDAAPAMIAECRRNLAPSGHGPYQLRGDGCGRGGRPCRARPHRLEHDACIGWPTRSRASSACAGCSPLAASCSTPRSGLRASPSGATCWRAKGLPSGLAEIQPLPGCRRGGAAWRPTPTRSPSSSRMKAVGGLTPQGGLRAALARRAAPRHPRHRCAVGGRITWHIVYGRAQAPRTPSASSPSTMPA